MSLSAYVIGVTESEELEYTAYFALSYDLAWRWNFLSSLYSHEPIGFDGKPVDVESCRKLKLACEQKCDFYSRNRDEMEIANEDIESLQHWIEFLELAVKHSGFEII